MFNKVKSSNLELVCPSCTKNTKIKTEDGVQCKHCETSFKGFTFKRKKFFTRAAAILLVSGAVTGVTLNEVIEDERLSYESEFTLMTACVNRYGITYRSDDLEDRIEQCSCSVRKAVNDLGINSNSNDSDEVMDAFLAEVNSAMKKCG